MRRRTWQIMAVLIAFAGFMAFRAWRRASWSADCTVAGTDPMLAEVAYPGATFNCHSPVFFLTNDSAAEIVAFYRDPSRPHKLSARSWPDVEGRLILAELGCSLTLYALQIDEGFARPTQVNLMRLNVPCE